MGNTPPMGYPAARCCGIGSLLGILGYRSLVGDRVFWHLAAIVTPQDALVFCVSACAPKRSEHLSLFRNRVISARMKRMATKNAPHRQKKPHEKAVLAKGLQAIA